MVTMNLDYLVTFPSPEINFAAGGPGVVSALRSRHSAHRFEPNAPLPFLTAGRILNESAGMTTQFGRGTPSPGGVNPLECYVVALNVERVQPGVYRYDPVDHGLRTTLAPEHPEQLIAASRVQRPVAETEAMHVFVVADLSVARLAYGDNALRFVLLEAGHLVQSMLLLAVNEGVGACAIGRFDTEAVDAALGLDTATHAVVHSVAFGRQAEERTGCPLTGHAA